MQNYCISIDWLQTFNHAATLAEGNYHGEMGTYTVKMETTQTAQFLRVYTVYWKQLPVATICQQPRTPVMHPASTSLKLANRVLYCERYIELLYDLNRALHLYYKGITRIDICLDCNELAGGRQVARFLRQYVTAEPLTPGHIIRSGSSRFTCHGTRSKTSACNITSIRWGSPKTKVQAYCYDKTLELIEVKDKPWIRDMWEANGLEYSINWDGLRKLNDKKKQRAIENEGLANYVEKHVWRFELSINSQGTDILNMSTGELFRLSPRYIEHRDNVRKLFFIYAGRYFDFRINTGQKRTRDYEKLQLFENHPNVTYKPYYMSKCADTGRVEKICYNRLAHLVRHYVDMSEGVRNSIHVTMEFLQVLSGKKASIVKFERYKHYLDTLVGGGYIAGLDLRLMSLLRYIWQTKGKDYETDPDALLDCITAATPTEEEIAQIEADAWAYDCEFWHYLPDADTGNLPR